MYLTLLNINIFTDSISFLLIVISIYLSIVTLQFFGYLISDEDLFILVGLAINFVQGI